MGLVSKRRLTLRATMIVVALFAADFAGLAWSFRPGIMRTSSFPELVLSFVAWFGPVGLLAALIIRYVPPRWDEVLFLILLLMILAGFFI